MYLLPLADGTEWFISSSGRQAGETLDLLAGALRLIKLNENSDAKHRSRSRDQASFSIQIRASRKKTSITEHPPIIKNRIAWRIGASQHPRIQFVHAFRIAQFIGMNVEQKGGVLLHGALLQKEGKGIILAGPSGVGKSTAGARVVAPWRTLSDDMVLVVKKSTGEYRAHPWPTWSRVGLRDHSGYVNATVSVPLIGIFFIQQSKKDMVIPIEKRRSLGLLLGCAEIATGSMLRHLPQKTIVAILKNRFLNLCDIASTIPQYRLKVSKNGSFWKKIENILGI